MSGGVAAARTLPDLLRLRAESSPEAEGLRFEGASLTFAELAERARRVAAALADTGVGPGDRVALMLPNGLDFPVAWLAAPLLGAVAVPVHASYREADLGHVLRHSGARRIVAGPEQAEVAARVGAGCPRLEGIDVVGAPAGDSADLPAAAPEARSLSAASEAVRPCAWPARSLPGAPVTIQYTSGTTGLPKGCVLDHDYWLTLARVVQRHAALGPGDVALTAQRQSYMDPSWNLLLALLAGVPLAVLERFSASGFWGSAREHAATFFYCIGTMPLYLWRQPPSAADRDHRVRLVYCSGIPPELHAAFEERWGCTWRETYGSTELGAVFLSPPHDVAAVGTGSMGEPLPGCEVRVVDERGRDVAGDGPGELLVRGAAVMRGYWDDPNATAAWMPDGWARTGDLVVRAGRGFRLVGRARDVIRRSGENISAAEIEAVLGSHPAVTAAACIAVPDADRGEEAKAYVQLTPDADPEGAGPPALHRFLAERLAPFKVPRFVEIVDAFPLTVSEKIAKAELVASREDHRAGAWDAMASAPSPDDPLRSRGGA